MRIFNLILLALFLFLNTTAQTDLTVNLKSEVLQTERPRRIHLPKTYNNSENKIYPLIITLDAQTTYYITVGSNEIKFDPNPDYRIIPENIIVGIDQGYSFNGDPNSEIRWKDSRVNVKTGKFTKHSADFYKFIKEELIPYLKREL